MDFSALLTKLASGSPIGRVYRLGCAWSCYLAIAAHHAAARLHRWAYSRTSSTGWGSVTRTNSSALPPGCSCAPTNVTAAALVVGALAALLMTTASYSRSRTFSTYLLMLALLSQVGASTAWMLLVWGLVLLAVLWGLLDRDGGVVAHVLVGLFLALIDGLAPLLWTVGEQSSPTLSAPPTDSGPHAAEPRFMPTGARPLPLHPAAARHTARARPRPTSSP